MKSVSSVSAAEAASQSLDERTILPSKSWREDGADTGVGFDPRGTGMSKQLTPAVDRGDDANPGEPGTWRRR